jgi:hypothetical protein
LRIAVDLDAFSAKVDDPHLAHPGGRVQTKLRNDGLRASSSSRWSFLSTPVSIIRCQSPSVKRWRVAGMLIGTIVREARSRQCPEMDTASRGPTGPARVAYRGAMPPFEPASYFFGGGGGGGGGFGRSLGIGGQLWLFFSKGVTPRSR